MRKAGVDKGGLLDSKERLKIARRDDCNSGKANWIRR